MPKRPAFVAASKMLAANTATKGENILKLPCGPKTSTGSGAFLDINNFWKFVLAYWFQKDRLYWNRFPKFLKGVNNAKGQFTFTTNIDMWLYDRR